MRSRPAPALPLVAIGGGVAAVVMTALGVVSGVTDGLDVGVIRAVRAEEHRGWLTPLRQITELGSTAAVIAVGGIAFVIAMLIGPWRHGVAAALTVIFASLLNATLKLAIARERPDLLEPLVVERGFSFPSGHSALGMVAYGVISIVVWRSRLPRRVRIGVCAFALALVFLIGLSRVWLGAHYPTDVLAGWISGAVVVAVYAWATRSVSEEPSPVAVDEDAPPV